MTTTPDTPPTQTASDHIRYLASCGLTAKQITERYDYNPKIVWYALNNYTGRKRGRPKKHTSGDACRRCHGTGREP